MHLTHALVGVVLVVLHNETCLRLTALVLALVAQSASSVTQRHSSEAVDDHNAFLRLETSLTQR